MYGGLNEEQVRAVAAITTEPKLAELFIHMLDQVHGDREALTALVRSCSTEALTEAKSKLPDPEPSIEARRAEFIERYKVHVLGEFQVEVSLQGASCSTFLAEAQALRRLMDGSDHILPITMKVWQSMEQCQEPRVDEAGRIRVDGNVNGSSSQTRREQEESGLNDVSFLDLGVAHIAFFIATHRDLFGGNTVRARGGALSYRAGALNFGFAHCNSRDEGITASRCL